MKIFYCQQCQNQVFFNNIYCEKCQAALGYIVEKKIMGTFKPVNDQVWQHADPKDSKPDYKPCYNYVHHQVCNWMIPVDDPNMYCPSCQLTHKIPDLSIPENKQYWGALEQAKRRFLYLTQQMNILPRPKTDDHDRYGLRFNFLMPLPHESVMTGHADGVITLNASEADVVHRERTRLNMGENYRTLLGHFRHESGHYYFDLLTHTYPEWLEEFRQLFGDERQDYAKALEHHYEQGAPENWSESYISQYASAHPWEDWAETWAHYLHMMDTLDTAYHAGLRLEPNRPSDPAMKFKESPIGSQDFEQTLINWFALSYSLNALNRSMGLEDAYPFTLSDTVLDKLRFIHSGLLRVALQPEVREA
ncbi:zinc-binding metallopeptidase family protein [Acinetobacter radioresistens]|uniref:zinc-binding metallopeptidase family protein n=1 Tax=Acinetobacter radioresistens TaxID=40216 RepID=UPI000E74594A|nr:putative zinc-binding peptidase [Acinetobacter radioresistens]RJL69142.1 hypothetical protein D5055_15230 [Acinetobacter radioresistens]